MHYLESVLIYIVKMTIVEESERSSKFQEAAVQPVFVPFKRREGRRGDG